jgi:hypothetical protein
MSDEDDDFFMPGATVSALVVRRTEGMSTEDIIEKVLVLAEALAGHKLYPYQKQFGSRVIQSVLERESEEITALFSRQSGKSETLAAICSALMVVLPMLAQQFPEDDRFRYFDPRADDYRSYETGFWIGVYAPKRSQAAIIFSRIRNFLGRQCAREILAEAGLDFSSNNGDTIRLTNGSSCICSTASDQANIEGTTLHLGILDESQDISDLKASKSIGPMLAATGGTLVKIGTANAKKSHFYNSVRRNIRREAQGGSKCHFRVDWREAARFNTFYEQFVRKEMLRLGEHSDEFRMAYMCEFMLSRGLAIDEATFDGRCVIEGPYSDFVHVPRFGMHYVAGIDFGKMHDSTVITVLEVDWDQPRHVFEGYDPETGPIHVELYGKHVCAFMEMQGDDYEAQFLEIRRFLSTWHVERMCLDYTGVGMAIGDRAKAIFDYADVELVPFSLQEKDNLARLFQADVHTGNITWPAGPKCAASREFRQFKAQMLDLEKEYKQGCLIMHHPDMRGAKDDYPDSLMLAIRAASSRPFSGEVEEGDNILLRSR